MTFLARVLRDRLFRRFLVASSFAGAFVWVAIDAFDVRAELILEFFVLSIVLVSGLVIAALPCALLIRLWRRRRTELDFDAHSESPPQNADPKV